MAKEETNWVGEGIGNAMEAFDDEPATGEGIHEIRWAYGTSGRRYDYIVELNQVFVYEPVPVPGSKPDTLVEAIDVASFQPRDLTAIINGLDPRPEHVVVHLYLGPGYEAPSQDITREQIYSAQANGCTAGGYLFCYAGLDPRESVRRALGVAESAGGFIPPVLWLDVEEYEGETVSAAWVGFAVAEANRLGVNPGIYTSRYMWSRLGNPTSFASLPLWDANYGAKPDDLSITPYGGWTVAAGRQWTSDPLDRNLFSYAVTAPAI